MMKMEKDGRHGLLKSGHLGGISTKSSTVWATNFAFLRRTRFVNAYLPRFYCIIICCRITTSQSKTFPKHTTAATAATAATTATAATAATTATGAHQDLFTDTTLFRALCIQTLNNHASSFPHAIFDEMPLKPRLSSTPQSLPRLAHYQPFEQMLGPPD